MAQTLELRTTHNYADGYSHLDASMSLGTVETLMSTSRSLIEDENDYDPCDPTEIMMLVRVTLDRTDHSQPVWTDHQIRQALKDTFSGSSCQHDHDCCGCWTTRVSEVLQRNSYHYGEYVVITHASRNF